MYLIPFYLVEPELAADETRVMHLLVAHDQLPAGQYALLEHYCPDPDCDCRRVMFTVVREDRLKDSLASISYAFDRDGPMPGPFIDRMNAQSRHAEALLALVKDAVLTDPRFLARLERHYAMVKRAASDPDHPAYDQLQELMQEGPEHAPHRAMTSPSDTVGRNEPCPCGSGRKYKHCCMRKDRWS
ncbi:MAG: SEC-C metal-binding domain-containing protein [Planctomycetota bacterium]